MNEKPNKSDRRLGVSSGLVEMESQMQPSTSNDKAHKMPNKTNQNAEDSKERGRDRDEVSSSY